MAYTSLYMFILDSIMLLLLPLLLLPISKMEEEIENNQSVVGDVVL